MLLTIMQPPSQDLSSKFGSMDAHVDNALPGGDLPEGGEQVTVTGEAHEGGIDAGNLSWSAS